MNEPIDVEVISVEAERDASPPKGVLPSIADTLEKVAVPLESLGAQSTVEALRSTATTARTVSTAAARTRDEVVPAIKAVGEWWRRMKASGVIKEQKR